MSIADTLDKITAFIDKYTVLPTEHAAPTIALWVAHTWTSTAFYTSPRLVLSSPVPGSGKTRVLELLDVVCFHPKLTISSSTAALFRRIGKAHREDEMPPTILFDETDALFGNNRPSEQTEQLRSLMNSGYKRGATIDRCEGDAANMEVIEWPVFSPLALAGLAGKLPDTIVTRSIVIEMRKRAPGEKIAPYRERAARAEAQHMVDALKEWSAGAIRPLSSARPEMPKGVEDRPAEVWEPLLAVADAAGGHWPETARAACTYFVHAPKLKTPSLGIELLSDIRDVMGHGPDSDHLKVDRIKTTELLLKLKDLDESPWAGLDGGGGLTARRLAQFMAGYSVAPVTYKDYGTTHKGYMVAGNVKQVGLADAWNRYLPAVSEETSPTPSPKSVTPVTEVTPQVTGGENGYPEEKVTDTQKVTVTDEVTENVPLTSTVTPVTQVTQFGEGEGKEQAGTDLKTLVLDLLSNTHPMGLGKIMRLAKEAGHPGADVPDILTELTQAGLVTEHAGMKFTRKAPNG